MKKHLSRIVSAIKISYNFTGIVYRMWIKLLWFIVMIKLYTGNIERSRHMLRIGMLTSGGDCQALNAAMRGVVKGLFQARKDVEIYGFEEGYKGLITRTSECLKLKISQEF